MANNDYTPTSVNNGFEMEVAINQHFTDIKTALDGLLSRLSTSDKSLEQDLDIGGYNLLNLPAPTEPTHPTRLVDLSSLAVTEVVQNITWLAAVDIDSTTMTYAKIVLAGNTTITLTGTPDDGRPLLVTVQQDATGSRTLTWGASVRIGDDVPADVSTTANKLDYFLFRYNADAAKFDLLAINKGF